MPKQSFAHTSVTAAGVDVVWRKLNEAKTWEAIGGVDRVYDPVVDDSGDLVGFSFESIAAGKAYVGTARPRRREEGHLLSWDIQNREIRGVTRVELSPADTGTNITVTLEVESTGMMSAMFFPVIAAAVGNGLANAVDDFAAALSNGT